MIVVSDVEYTKRSEITTFKARIKASKPHYLQKVIAHKVTIKDALKPHFCSTGTIFYPKLKPTQQKPVCMFSMSNGGGGCLVRSDRYELADFFDELANTLRSDEWVSKWKELCSISEDCIVGADVVNKKYMDAKDFATLEKEKEDSKYSDKPPLPIDEYM